MPAEVDHAVGDVAIVFGFGLSELYALELEDLLRWWAQARRRREDARG